MKKPQTIIIGAGPGGASAAIYLARCLQPVMLFDASKKVPGRTARGTNLDNYLGHHQVVSGKEFLAKVAKQLAALPVVRKNEKVVKVSQKANRLFEVKTDKPAKYLADYLIIAVGMVDIMPKIKGLEPYYDTAIFHCPTCDWYMRRKRRIAIVCDDDKGIISALRMTFYHPQSRVSVFPQKSEAKYSRRLIQKARKAGIKIYLSPIEALIGRGGILKQIKLADGTMVLAEVLFTKLGHQHLDGFLKKGGINVRREREGYIRVNPRTFETSLKNLFAVGPCNDMTDQAIVAGGEGAIAAMEIDSRILGEAGI